MLRSKWLPVLAVALAGCSTHRFQLADVERLKPGVSTRADVERFLGPPCEPPSGEAGALQIVERDARMHFVSTFRGVDGGRVLYLSRETQCHPCGFFAWFLWPVYCGYTLQGFAVLATFDQNERLLDASVTVSWFTPTQLYLMCIPGQPYLGGTLTAGEAETLKRIERNGLWVAVSPHTLREHLRRNPTNAGGPTASSPGSPSGNGRAAVTSGDR